MQSANLTVGAETLTDAFISLLKYVAMFDLFFFLCAVQEGNIPLGLYMRFKYDSNTVRMPCLIMNISS